MSETYDLIVIGGGSAGLVAAGGAALLGARVALIEKKALGGDCLYTGCVPSKALIRSAKLAHDLKRAAEFGLRVDNWSFRGEDFASVTRRVQRVIEKIEPHDSPERFERMGVRVFIGAARFLNRFEIEVDLKDTGEAKTFRAKRFCLATGSSPFIPPIEGLSETGFITNEEIFHLERLPARLVVLGGGAIGAEMAQAFGRFGAEVTLVEAEERILSKEDEDASRLIEEVFRREGIRVLTGAKAVRARKDGRGEKFLTVERDGSREELAADEILVAVGRRANVHGLALEKAGVRYDEKRIETDDYLRTSARHVFAAGDVTARFQFTHMADYEAQIALQNCFVPSLFRKKADYGVVPWATFTEPEIARVGLTEREAREKFGEIKVIKVAFEDNDRAQTEGETEGFAKILLRGKQIVGAHLAGPRAAEVIHEFVLAMRLRLSLDDLNRAIHVYPTLSKITQAAATEKTIETLQSPFVRKWFARYLKIWR